MTAANLWPAAPYDIINGESLMLNPSGRQAQGQWGDVGGIFTVDELASGLTMYKCQMPILIHPQHRRGDDVFESGDDRKLLSVMQ